MARVSVMNTFRSSERPLYNKYKRCWKSILTPYEQVEAFIYHKVPLYKKWKTPRGIVNHLLSYDNIPLNTHTLVIDLRFVLKENNKEAFEKALNNIEMNSVSPKLQTSIKPFRKHHEMIRNTFDFNNLRGLTIK